MWYFSNLNIFYQSAYLQLVLKKITDSKNYFKTVSINLIKTYDHKSNHEFLILGLVLSFMESHKTITQCRQI